MAKKNQNLNTYYY